MSDDVQPEGEREEEGKSSRSHGKGEGRSYVDRRGGGDRRGFRKQGQERRAGRSGRDDRSNGREKRWGSDRASKRDRFDSGRDERRQPGRRDGRQGFAGRGEGRDDRRGFAPRNDRRGERLGERRERTPKNDMRYGVNGPGERQPGGPRLAPRQDRRPDPVVPEGITGQELPRQVRAELRTLSKDAADHVSKHLVAAAHYMHEDPEAAMAHAETALRRGGRVAPVREAMGLVAYSQGDYARALAEFRTARRLSGSHHVLPHMVDCERGLGRHQRALDLARSPEARTLDSAGQVELAIVVSGVRRDQEDPAAAIEILRPLATRTRQNDAWAARLWFAYAEAINESGDEQTALQWYRKAAAADTEGETEAALMGDADDTVLIGWDDDDESPGGEVQAQGGEAAREGVAPASASTATGTSEDPEASANASDADSLNAGQEAPEQRAAEDPAAPGTAVPERDAGTE